jgi:long-subunit fatty acid transport protein
MSLPSGLWDASRRPASAGKPGGRARRRRAIPLAAWLVAAGAAAPQFLAAQESVFGALGFGLPEDGLSVRSRGMGNAGSALPGIQFSFRNPAALAVFDRSGISLGGVLQTRRPEDANGDSRQNDGEVPFAQLAFPLGHGLVLGGGYYRYLDFDGFVDTFTAFQGESLATRLRSDGGVSVLSPQLAFRINRFVRVGAGADFYTGSRELRRLIEIDPALGVPTTDSLSFSFSGTGFTVGTQIAPTRRLIVAAGYRSPATLGGDLDFAPGFDREEASSDTASNRDIDVDLPATIVGSVSYRFGRDLVVAGEVESASWSDFAIDDRPDPAYRDALGVGLGIEYALPSRLWLLPEGSLLRAGARTRELPRRFAGNTVRERAASLGVGRVIGIGATSMDLALEVGKRGSLDENGLEEAFLRFDLSFSAFEKWVGRTPEGGGGS